MAQQRLDRFLANQGLGSRSQVKEMIRRGRVMINGEAVRQPDQKVAAGRDHITADGCEISFSPFCYYMLNKPAGVITAVRDKHDKTVLDLMADVYKEGLFPVGRLDKDTEGLLLVTNDGPLAHKLLSPRKHVDKTYFARVAGQVTKQTALAFAEGLSIGGGKLTLPASLELLCIYEEQGQTVSEVSLILREGRFHQVKRMFHQTGMEVLYLKRTGFSCLCLDQALKPGEYRKLTKEELGSLKGEGN